MKTLSKSEAMVMEKSKAVIRAIDVIGILTCTKNQAHVILYRLSKKGWLTRIERDLFINPEKITSPYHLLPILSKRYYISYFTALNYHALTTQLPFVIFVANLDKTKSIRFQNTVIKFIKISKKKFFGFKKIKFGQNYVFIADKEKGLIDSLDKPKYSGGLEHVISCFKADINTKRLIRYAFHMGNRVLIRRLGAILDKLQTKIPVDLEKRMLRKSSKVAYYARMDRSRGEGKRIPKWRVIWNVR